MKTFFYYLMLVGVMVFSACEEEDPCDGVVCNNGGGNCNEGVCECPEMWTGTYCDFQRVPTKIIVTNIRVTQFPQLDGTSSWDVTSSKPDIYPIFLDSNGNELWRSTSYYDECTSGNNYDFACTFAISNALDSYALLLYDYDSTSDDEYMGGVTFNVYHTTNGFPEEIEIFHGSFRFYLTVAYEF